MTAIAIITMVFLIIVAYLNIIYISGKVEELDKNLQKIIKAISGRRDK